MVNVICLPPAQRRSGRRRTIPLSGMPRAKVISMHRERTVEEKLEDAKATINDLAADFLSAIHAIQAHMAARDREACHD